MQPSGRPAARLEEGGPEGFGGGLVPEPYDSFMRSHLRYYGYFRGQKKGGQKSPASPGGPDEAPSPGSAHHGCLRGPGQELSSPGVLELPPSSRGTPVPSAQYRGSLGEPRALFALPSARGPPPAPRWPIECEVIKETIEHIEWVPPEPEPFCQSTGHEWPSATLGEEQGTVVYHLSPVPPGSCFTRARVGGAPGPLSSPAVPLEGPQDTTLVFESRFESGNLQKAVKVGPYEYVLTLRPDLYTAKHTQWFYFRVQNTRRDPLYRFTIANLAKPKSLYGEGMRPLLYSQRDAQSCGIGCGGAGAGPRLRQRIFPLMLSKNAPDKFSFPSCKFKVQKSKAGTGRVVMWHMGVSNSYTMEVAFGGSTLGGRSSHFNVEDLKSLGYHLCDTLLDFCDPHPAKFQQCLSEVDELLRQRLHREPDSGWSDVSPSELESSTSGSDSSVSDGPPAHLHGPAQPLEQRRRKQRRSRRARDAQHRTNTVYQSRASVPVSLDLQAQSTQSLRGQSCRDTCPRCCPSPVPAPLRL
ncbi:PREDICTED: cytosolic carboxypeptidase 2 [Charadrius vociferus]|uniref:cytosolic carboxypeptidase 2 n=1 Tax=Charadrius vociferus TaxID=50402 RepID=UPI000521BAE8|nr:PREDICTED: cytosolic carboxypeptidase 2 [Charadrius vociferus]